MTIDDDVSADFALMNAPVDPEQISNQDDEAFEVWKENWESLCAFLAVETQWRVLVGGTAMIWLGLDYTAVDVVLRRRSAPDAIFEDIQAMEAAALKVFAETER